MRRFLTRLLFWRRSKQVSFTGTLIRFNEPDQDGDIIHPDSIQGLTNGVIKFSPNVSKDTIWAWGENTPFTDLDVSEASLIELPLTTQSFLDIDPTNLNINIDLLTDYYRTFDPRTWQDPPP